MGTQQILMVVLSVIVVGTAVAIGIQMFDTQGQNQARNALVADLMRMSVEAQAWFRTPRLMGGGGGTISNEGMSHEYPDNALYLIVKYIDSNATPPRIQNENGRFDFAISAAGDVVTITGYSNYKSTNEIRSFVAVNLDQGHAGIKMDPLGENMFSP